ncbi:MAG: electron transfer flavoprotein subunit beta/FixA family protein [Halobacteriales archaeon]
MEEIELGPDGDIDDEWLEYELNEWDEYALEAAVQLKEAHGGSVTVVTMGDEGTEETLRRCLAKGADEAVRIADEAIHEFDTVAKARVLANVIEGFDESPDLVYTGLQAGDTVHAQAGGAMAAELELPFTSFIVALDYDPQDEVAIVRRELEGGLEERREIEVPAVLGIQTGINDPRYASIREIRAARDKPLTVVAPRDRGLDVETISSWSKTRIDRLYEPESEDLALIFEGSADETAADLVNTFEDIGVGV